MQKVKMIPEEQKHKINIKLKPYGVEIENGSLCEGKVCLGLDKGCAVTCNYKKLAYFIWTLLQGDFATPSAIIVDGREFAF